LLSLIRLYAPKSPALNSILIFPLKGYVLNKHDKMMGGFWSITVVVITLPLWWDFVLPYVLTGVLY
ncbi:MAG: hypothetical protein SVM80_02450, partial [Halobacteriota archaeon]|nr:hypothetical protein [Halobacteriota archaeon]